MRVKNSRPRNMKAVSLCFGVAAATAVLTGCGSMGSSNNYLKAKEMPPMVLPEGSDPRAVGELYPVPDASVSSSEVTEFSVPRPQPVSANVFEELVKIQSYEDDRWILINQPPEEIWPRVRNILTRSGIPAPSVDPTRGWIETGWLQFKDDGQNSHRFRFSIEPAVQLSSTEIRILHMQAGAGAEEGVLDWPSASDSDGREQEMIDIISNALAAEMSGPSVSLLAQSIGGEEKVELVAPKASDPYIDLKLPYQRAWASVVYSLEKGGFTIEDLNQSAGTLFVLYKPEENKDEKKGFFSRMLKSSKEQPGVPYQVIVRNAGSDTEVRIIERDNRSLDPSLALKLLRIIRANLT